MSNYGIQLRTKRTALQPEGNHRLRIWVSDYEGLEPEIFVYQREPLLPEETSPEDVFVNVASAADMEEYPANAPAGDSPFFRLSRVDLIFRSVDIMDRTWNAIKTDVEYLLVNLDKLDALGAEATWDFGVLFNSSSSSSSSSSEAPHSGMSSSSSSESSSSSLSSSSPSSSSSSSESSSSESSSSSSSFSSKSDSSASESSVNSSSSSSQSSSSLSSSSSSESSSGSSPSSSLSSSESTMSDSSASESSGGWAGNESSSSSSST